MGNTIYYFTGTGNSLQIAKYLRDQLEDTEIIRVCKKNMNVSNNKPCERIGFVFPVYYRGLPKMLVNFIKNLYIESNTYVFAVADYGGSPALVFEQIEALLAEKGTKLSGAFGMDMPGNMWFMHYPHPKQVTIDRITTEKDRAFSISKQIEVKADVKYAEISNREEEANVYRQILDISEKDKGFWCDENCVGCGICAKICPAENIELVQGKPVWQHNCEYCLACLHWCPKHSIQFENITQNKERYHNPNVKVQELFIN